MSPLAWQICSANSTAQMTHRKTVFLLHTYAAPHHLIWGQLSCTNRTADSGANSGLGSSNDVGLRLVLCSRHACAHCLHKAFQNSITRALCLPQSFVTIIRMLFQAARLYQSHMMSDPIRKPRTISYYTAFPCNACEDKVRGTTHLAALHRCCPETLENRR